MFCKYSGMNLRKLIFTEYYFRSEYSVTEHEYSVIEHWKILIQKFLNTLLYTLHTHVLKTNSNSEMIRKTILALEGEKRRGDVAIVTVLGPDTDGRVGCIGIRLIADHHVKVVEIPCRQ